ncbi:Coatomer [Macleaya cordata]|uniref:Coatomer n=1 Tax=Macleaya cordata TaxID=56857 RepID=A0A200Q0Q7_MACCD|nr:Coatomer [Macleaya cordata]
MDHGRRSSSSVPVELTEAETEYAVNVVKHIFDGHVVFQYNCTNTIPEQLLENVIVIVDASEAEDYSEVASKPLRSLPYDSPGQTFVAFEKPEGVVHGKFSNMLRFIVKELGYSAEVDFCILISWEGDHVVVDPTTGEAEDDGVEDEYQLEDLEIVAADFMLKVGVSNFRNAWESMGEDCERVDEYGLGVRESLAEAVNAVINILGMQPCEVVHPMSKSEDFFALSLTNVLGNFNLTCTHILLNVKYLDAKDLQVFRPYAI